MKALNLIAGLAFACLATGSYAQSCSGHAHAKTEKDPVSSVVMELKLDADQQAAFRNALAACEKDCHAMASADTKPELLKASKTSRFNEAIASMKSSLSAEQFSQLEEMNKNGQLAGLCGEGSKGCCAGKASKAGCCAGKASNKADAGSSPTIVQ